MVFKGNWLDIIAKKTASEWNQYNQEYSSHNFRTLVAELGIVGRIRSKSKLEGYSLIEADFEYFQRNRLMLQNDDECVIHPMFYKKFNIKIDKSLIIYPFPDHPEFDKLKEYSRFYRR